MKVYLAEIGWDYEGSEILGIFTTREKAEEQLAIRKMAEFHRYDGTKVSYNRGDWAQVNEMELEE